MLAFLFLWTSIRQKTVGVYKNTMKEFLKEIGNLGMSHIEFESIVILLMALVLVHILFRYKSNFRLRFFYERLSSFNQKRSANARTSKQLSKFITAHGQCSLKIQNTRDKQYSRTNIDH